MFDWILPLLLAMLADASGDETEYANPRIGPHANGAISGEG